MGVFDRFIGRRRRAAPAPATSPGSGDAAPGRTARAPQMKGYDDWQPGDLAECIEVDGWFDLNGTRCECGPAYSEVRMVRAVRLTDGPLGAPALYLEFDRYAPRVYHAACFCKIRPRADEATRAAAGPLDFTIREHA